MENQLLVVCAIKLIIYLRCVHNHHKEKNKYAFLIIFKRKRDEYCCQGEYGQPYAPCGLSVAVLIKLN
jgi:hypothetical protein